MTTLETLRTALTADLQAQGLFPVAFVPERPAPPLAVVVPGAPYVATGDTFGTYKVRFDVVLMTAKATNETETIDLDTSVQAALEALANSARFYLEEITRPAYFQINGTDLFGVTLSAFTLDTLEED